MADRRNRHIGRRQDAWRSPLAIASMALAVIGCAFYVATVPSLAAAHQAAIPRVNARDHGSLGRTTGSVWGVVVARALFGGSPSADGAQVTSDGALELADGEQTEAKQIVSLTSLTSSNGQGLIAAVTSSATSAGSGSATGASTSNASQGSHAGSSGSTKPSGTTGGSAGGGSGSTSGGAASDGTGGSTEAPSAGPSNAEEAELHSWLVTKANALDGYVSRVNTAISTYRSTGDTSACDALDSEIFSVRAQFGRKYVSNESRWAGQFEALWGCYTNLNIFVGSYGTNQDALTNYNAFRGRLAL